MDYKYVAAAREGNGEYDTGANNDVLRQGLNGAHCTGVNRIGFDIAGHEEAFVYKPDGTFLSSCEEYDDGSRNYYVRAMTQYCPIVGYIIVRPKGD